MIKPLIKEYFKTEFWNVLPSSALTMLAMWTVLCLIGITDPAMQIFIMIAFYFYMTNISIHQFEIDKLLEKINTLESENKNDTGNKE